MRNGNGDYCGNAEDRVRVLLTRDPTGVLAFSIWRSWDGFLVVSFFSDVSRMSWTSVRERGNPIHQSRSKKGLNMYALTLSYFLPQWKSLFDSKEFLGGQERPGGGKWTLPYISLIRQKESNYSALRRVNTGAVLDNVTKKQRKVRIFLPTCPRPSDKRVFLLFTCIIYVPIF